MLGRELMNTPIEGLSESDFERRAAGKRNERSVREVPILLQKSVAGVGEQ